MMAEEPVGCEVKKGGFGWMGRSSAGQESDKGPMHEQCQVTLHRLPFMIIAILVVLTCCVTGNKAGHDNCMHYLRAHVVYRAWTASGLAVHAL